ncbi:hypothetical protein CIB84_017047 [Bambusicola thoracicus]|uniref:Uncharacterized protein n=1 Tax=Bambusicola thoracicus TaxID=9083 RepID=A0A2P4S544_BAMTH|nr:hypothetical protein CIB84_017047 [Bambusicola thoracicus]
MAGRGTLKRLLTMPSTLEQQHQQYHRSC